VYALCCAFSAVLLAYQVYVGKEDDVDNSAVAICHRLCKEAHITGEKGHVLYTDNWYTGIKLCKEFFEEYGWTVVGTVTTTDKKARADEDIPFLKLSNGARDGVERGWYREAVIKMVTKHRRVYYIQCTTWRDKKQVCFLSTNKVGASHGLTVKRHTKRRAQRETLAAPRAQRDYVNYFNAVDRNDRDSADYSTTIKTCRYYIRIFCWILDRVVHTIFVCIITLVKFGIGKPEWKRYGNKHQGRHDFQVDLAISLINYAIEREWDGKSEKPDWMRQRKCVPCSCQECYFCLNGITTGVTHISKNSKLAVHYKCGATIRTARCVDVAVFLDKGCDYCKMCMRKLKGKIGKNGNKLTWNQKKNQCTTSTYGCPQRSCNEHVCRACWAEGYDKHRK
jgi:hypothetical protein